MSTLIMKYGNSGVAGGNNSDMVYSGVVDDSNTDDLVFESSSIYVLYTKEYNASTGAYRGHRGVLIATPEEGVTAAVGHTTFGASSNSGVTITYNNDGTVTIARSSATYAVKYAVYKVL